MTPSLDTSSGASSGTSIGVARRVIRAWRMVLANYAFRALAAIFGARAVVDWIAPSVAGLREGDRDLFGRGAAPLVEAGLRGMSRLGAVATTQGIVLSVVAVLGVFPFAALVESLARPSAGGRVKLGARTVSALVFGAKLALLLGLAAIIEVVLLGFGVFAAAQIERPRETPTMLAAALGLAMLGVVPWWITVTLHDLARVGVVARGRGVLGAIAGALRALRRRPLAVIAASLGASLASLVVAAIGFAAALSIGLGATAQVVAVLVVQQLAIIGTVVIRASYFARLIEIDLAVAARDDR